MWWNNIPTDLSPITHFHFLHQDSSSSVVFMSGWTRSSFCPSWRDDSMFLLVFSTSRCENVTEKKDHFPPETPTIRATNQIGRSVAVLRDGGRLKLAAWCQVVMWLRLSDLLEHPAVGFCCWAEAPQTLQTALLTSRLKFYQFIEEYNL